MKRKEAKIATVFLYSLFNVVVCGLENRFFIPLFGVRLLKVPSPPPLREQKRWFNGALRHYGSVVRCDDALADFDLCERDEKRQGNKEKYHYRLKKGFLRVGGMVTPPRGQNLPLCTDQPETWTPAQGEPPAPDVVHRGEAVFIDLSFNLNPALLFRQMYKLLHYLEFLNVDVSNTTLISANPFPKAGALDEIVTRLFNVRHVKDLHGVYMFPKLSCSISGAQPGWQSGEASELLRRYLFPAFGLPPRRRSKDVNRITLVSRHDHKVNYGMNRLTRKISNENEVVKVLRRHFPAAEVHAVRLERLSAEEQLRLIGETDVLIGMHGAALGYAALLPENAALLELFPCWFLKAHYFVTFYPVAVNNGVHYRRWINLNPMREHASAAWKEKRAAHADGWARTEPKRDFVSVPSRAVLRRVKALQRAIRRGWSNSPRPFADEP